MKRMELAGLAVESTVGTPIVMLREHDEPHRVLPIFIGGPEAAAIALAASGEEAPRPLTNDLLATVLTALGGHITSVEVSGLAEGAFAATILVEGPTGELEIDARPSDAIALALRLGSPVFASDEVLDEAGTMLEPDDEDGDEQFTDEQFTDEEIDLEVEAFRTFLDELDPEAFDDPEDPDNEDL